MALEAFGLVLRGAGGAAGLWGSWQVTQPNGRRSRYYSGSRSSRLPVSGPSAEAVRVVVAKAPVQDMAVVALLGRDGLRGGIRGVDDRRVREAGLEGGDVVASRTVAALAADGAVGRLGADRIMPGTRVGHMAIQALRQAVPHADRFALKLGPRVRAVGWVLSSVERSQPFPSAV